MNFFSKSLSSHEKNIEESFILDVGRGKILVFDFPETLSGKYEGEYFVATGCPLILTGDLPEAGVEVDVKELPFDVTLSHLRRFTYLNHKNEAISVSFSPYEQSKFDLDTAIVLDQKPYADLIKSCRVDRDRGQKIGDEITEKYNQSYNQALHKQNIKFIFIAVLIWLVPISILYLIGWLVFSLLRTHHGQRTSL